MIRIRGLYKYYGTHRAVGPLSAEIGQGEVVGLLGLNGAGKTTTLRILACDLLPSAGSVEVDGVDVVQRPDQVRRMIGYLPDVPPLYDEMTVRDYLGFAAQLRGIRGEKTSKMVDQALSETALSDVADSAIAALSHGYRQRVGIAQAIVHQPKLAVLDEPSSGLDPVQIKEMRRLVRGLGGERTVLVSSHNLPEISEMCDRLLVIRDGRIVASGSEQELVGKLMHGERVEVGLRAKQGAGREDIEALLRGVDGVKGIESDHTDAQNEYRYLVVTEADARAKLSRAIVEAGHDLLTVSRSRRELENVFAQLATAKSDAESEAA